MEILEKRNILNKRTWELEVTCEDCGSRIKLKEEDNDIYKKEEYDIFDSFSISEGWRFFFICAVCDCETNFIDPYKIPEHIRREAIFFDEFQTQQGQAVEEAEKRRKKGVKASSRFSRSALDR